MSKTTLFLAIAATGLLALGGLATVVAAEGDSDSPRSKAQERRDDIREKRAELRENRTDENRSVERQDRHERMRAAHDAWQDCKREAVAANESVPESCGDEKSYFLNATKARREAHLLHGAIAALERRMGRLEAREIALEDQLEDGNLTANETAEIEAKIAKIDAHQERMADRLEALKERLEARQDRWHAVLDDEPSDDSDDEDDQDEEDLESSESSSSSSSSA